MADSLHWFGDRPGCATSSPWPSRLPALSGPSTSRGVAAPDVSIQPGSNALVGLHFSLEKAGTSIGPCSATPRRAAKHQVDAPTGHHRRGHAVSSPSVPPLGPLMDFGYEDEVLFPITLSADSTLKAPSTAPLSAHVNWLVCREVCIPGKAHEPCRCRLRLSKAPPTPPRQALFDRFHSLLPQPPPVHV